MLTDNYYERMFKKYSKDKDFYFQTLKAFSNSEYISTASIQRKMKVSYIRASVVLDMLILDGFASPRIGAYPSRVIKKRLDLL